MSEDLNIRPVENIDVNRVRTSPPPMPTPASYTTTTVPPKKKRGWCIVVAIILVLLSVCGICGFFSIWFVSAVSNSGYTSYETVYGDEMSENKILSIKIDGTILNEDPNTSSFLLMIPMYMVIQ